MTRAAYVVDIGHYGEPRRISYALADAQQVDARIDQLKSAVTIRSANDPKSAIAPGDRFRQRYLENGKEIAVDSYAFYGLKQPKTVEINAKLITSYAAIEFDLISESKHIELQLSYYDGSRWRLLGSLVDTVSDNPTIVLANPSARSIAFSYHEAAKQAEAGELLQNRGTLTLQLALARMDDADASADEQNLYELARNGKLQLRLTDPDSASADASFLGGARIERGGAIFTDGSSSGAVLRQVPGARWSSDLSSGTVQWLNPSTWEPVAQRKDLAFLSQEANLRSAGLYQRLNPQAPLATLLAVQQVEARSSSNLSASQSGALAAAELGVMRLTQDPISGATYKAYIGADRQVRIAMRRIDGQDWIDIATLGDLQLSATETHAPDLVAVAGQLVVASWNAAGALVTYRIDASGTSATVLIDQEIPTLVSTASVVAPAPVNGSRANTYGSAAAATATNRDLQIGLEKRLDLSSGSTSLQKAFYLSLLDPIQQRYATSARPLTLKGVGSSSPAGSQSLFDAAATWADPAAPAATFRQEDLEAQLRSLLGFGEVSSSGLFSGAQPGSSPASVRAASFMEFASTDHLSAHLAEWGSGSVFVLVGDEAGHAMVWNYDGDAYTRANADRRQREAVLSSGRVYNSSGIDAGTLSVVYKPVGQQDALLTNWQGLADAASAAYRQVPGTSLRSASSHSVDDLVAAGNLSLLITGTARNLAGAVQADASTDQVGGALASLYAYADGTPVLRYSSPERFEDGNGVYHWVDASNVAPLQLQGFTATGLNQAQQATAQRNSAGSLGGYGWVWTTANPSARERLSSLDASTGVGFIDAHTLNLALTGADLQGEALSSAAISLLPSSLQLLPTPLSPELFFASQGGSRPLNLSIDAGARSGVAVVLHGEELLNPQFLPEPRTLTSFGVLSSFFDGSRPYLASGDYVPLAYFQDSDSIFYGDLNAPVKLEIVSTLKDSDYGTSSHAVTPLGLKGAISDYVTYGVGSAYGEAVRELIRTMPAFVDDNYFKFVDNNFIPLSIGTILHAPMVPLFNNKVAKGRQTLLSDLTPWTLDRAELYVDGLRDISLGRGEPDSVLLEQLRLVGTYTESAQSLESFVANAWVDPVLKYGLLDKAVPVDAFNNSTDWLREFRRTFTGIEIPQALDLVTSAYPSLVNNTLFSPIAADAVISNYLPLPYKGPLSKDLLQYTHTLSAGGNLKFGFNAWPLSGNLFSVKVPFFNPRTWTSKRNSVTSGPLMGRFSIQLDENRNLSLDSGEFSKTVSQAFYQFDFGSRLDQILLDTSEAAGRVWDGADYTVVPQNGVADFRSGLIVTKPAAAGSVVDVMTGLVNSSIYLSRPDLSIADTHWESVKNAALLDYIPVSFVGVAAAGTSRWFADDPIANRTALSKLVPATLESAFKAAFRLPSGMASTFNSLTRVYDALALAASDPEAAPADLLQQYAFENRMMLLSGLISRLYQGLLDDEQIQLDQLGSPNSAAGYMPEIYAYQVFAYLALTLQGSTDPHYRQLLNLVAESVGTPAYAAAVAAPGYQLDLTNATDIALLLGFARLTLPTDGAGGFSFSDGRLDLSNAITLKAEIIKLGLPEVAVALASSLEAFDGIAAAQFAANPLLVTTAVSPLKTSLLESGGVLDQAADAILKATLDADLPSAPDPAAFTPLSAAEFEQINAAILQRSATSAVAPAVAGLSKATTVQQAFAVGSSSQLHEFTLRLSEPAPSGGAVFLLHYDGSAVYGSDYTIKGYAARPEYVHVPAGETSINLAIDVSSAINPSSLLIQLSSGSANYGISNSFNRLLMEIDGSNAGGQANLRQQVDNVQRISRDGASLLVGENLYDGVPRSTQGLQRQLLGSQPSIATPHLEINRYQSSLDATIVRLSATPPSNSSISGEWLLTSKAVFRAYAGNEGEVDVVELRDPSSGRFSYVADSQQRQSLLAQGWIDLGVVFSLDADRSLPVGIETTAQKPFDLSVPGFALSGASGYFDNYLYAADQEISEWRFLASIDNVAFNLDGQNYSLGGALALRNRQEYGDQTFWISADVDDFVLPSFGATANPVTVSQGRVALRIVDPKDVGGVKPARINQWQIAGAVENLPIYGQFILNGSLDARYENSAATNDLPTYWLSASVRDFDFSAGSLELKDLDVKLTDLKLVDGQIKAWTIDTQISSLQITEALALSGSLNLSYATSSAGESRFLGQAAVKDFSFDLGDTAVLIDNGSIAFEQVNGELRSWQLSASLPYLALANGLLKVSADAVISYKNTASGATLFAALDVSEASLDIRDDLNISLSDGALSLQAVDGSIRSLTGSALINSAELGFLSLRNATATIDYSRIPVRGSSTERLKLALSNASVDLDLGDSISEFSSDDVDLSLDFENGDLLGYTLAADAISFELAAGIRIAGSLKLHQETVVSGSRSQTHVYGSIQASSIDVDLPGIDFSANGKVSFELIDNKLHNLQMFAQVEELPIAGVDINGFLDLKFSEFSEGAPGKVVISGGVEDIALGLPGNGATLSGEVKELTLRPERQPSFVAGGGDGTLQGGSTYGAWVRNGEAAVDVNNPSIYQLLFGQQNEANWVVHTQKIPASAWSDLVVEFTTSVTGGSKLADAFSFGVFDYDTSTIYSGGGAASAAGTNGTAHSVLFDFYETQDIKVLNGTTQKGIVNTKTSGINSWRLVYSGTDRSNLTLKVYRDNDLLLTTSGVSVPQNSRLMFGAGSGDSSATVRLSSFLVDGYGPLTGKFQPESWELYGSVDGFSIGNQFTASGYARLSYKKTTQAQVLVSENLAGKVEVSEFSLPLPAGLQSAKVNGSVAFDLDFLHSPESSTRLNWFSFSAGVSNLALVDGVTISGDLSLEYQDAAYRTNTSGESRNIINAGLRNSSFHFDVGAGRSIDLTLTDGSLSNLVLGADGTLHSWRLQAVVQELDLLGILSLSGKLLLEYSRSSRTLTGSAVVSNFSLDLNGDGNDDLQNLSGGFSFGLKQDPVSGDLKLSTWSIAAAVEDFDVFGLFSIDGELKVNAELRKDGTNTNVYTINAKVDDFKLDLGNGVQASLSGELRNLVIADRNEGQEFEEMVRSWTFLAYDASLAIGDFSISGAAEISYLKSGHSRETITISASVSDFSLPAVLSQAGAMARSASPGALAASGASTLSGTIKATLTNDGAVSPTLSGWQLSAVAKNLSLAGLTVSGALTLSYSELSPSGASSSNPYYALDASFSELNLTLPGNRLLALSSGRFKLGFFDSASASSSLFSNPEVLEIAATLNEFTLTPELSLSGSFSLDYKNDLYTINSKIASLTLPGAKGTPSFGGSLSNLVIASTGEVLSWNASAFLKNLNFFDVLFFSGQASVSYANPISGAERFTLSASADELRFTLPGGGFDATLAGSLSLTIVEDRLDSLLLNASVKELDFLGFALTGDLSFSYFKTNPNFFNNETITLSRARVSAELLQGLLDVEVEVRDLLFSNPGSGWQAMTWEASASVSLDSSDYGGLPFELSGELLLAYNYLDPLYNQASLRVSGEVSSFSFASGIFSIADSELNLEELVLVDGQIREVELKGSIGSLRVLDLIELSGDFGISYFTDSGKPSSGTLEFDAQLHEFKIRQGDVYASLFDLLGIETASLKATVVGDDITFTGSLAFAPQSNFKIGDFNLGLESGLASITYSSISNDLRLDVEGRILLGNTNVFPVEGGFSVGVDLDSGTIALREASLLLTPDNKPVDLGLVQLQPGTLLSYANEQGENQITLQADIAVNTGFLDAVVTPIYDTINTRLSPVLRPVISGLTATLPIEQMVVPETSITIPAVRIPEIFISGYRRGLFGIRLPEFSVRMRELIPEQKIVVVPRLDLGKAALAYFESYVGAAYDDDQLQLIEVFDKVGSQIFKVNQLLARLGIGDAFQPVVSAFGPQAYTMEYPALAPFVKTVDLLLDLAAEQQALGSSQPLDLPALRFTYDLDDGQFDIQSGGPESLIASLGRFGELYNLVNNNPALATEQPEPINQNVVGFVDKSRLSFPLVDNLPKAIVDFVLDRPVDIFEYNLNLAAGFEARAEIAIPGEVTVPLIGIPLPIVLGGNLGLSAAIDATLGYAAPTKGIKAIANEIKAALGGGGLDVPEILEILYDAATDVESGAYLKLTDKLLTLDGRFSVDLGLDYKVAGVRAQLGFGSSMFAGLELKGPDADLDRLYLNALAQSLLADPADLVGKQANDLNLTLKLGNARIWTGLQAKVAASWITLLRLEGRIPAASGGLSVKLGTIYTGPTFGTARAIFDQDYTFSLTGDEVYTYSGFRDGTADQGDLYSRILAELFDDDLSGLLIVEPSQFARDITTGLSRSLALFDAISSADTLPDALTVITSLQSLPDLLRHHLADPTTPFSLDSSYLNGIADFDALVITAASSYQGLASSDSETRNLALLQLSMEYRLQALLLATQDYLEHFGVDALELGPDFTGVPQSAGLQPYLPLALFALRAQSEGGLQLDLNDADSLAAYFSFLNTLLPDSLGIEAGAVSAAAVFAADLVADVNSRIELVIDAVAPLDGPTQNPALALVALKRSLQSGVLASLLDSLRDQAATAAELRTLFQAGLDRPGSSQTQLRFATAGWSVADGAISFGLSAAASDLGAALNLLIDTDLEYGVDFILKDFQQSPHTLELAAGEQTLGISIERLRALPEGRDGTIRLLLLNGHSGVVVDPQANTLTLSSDGIASVGGTDLSSTALSSLAGVHLIEPVAGVFSVPAASTGKAQLLLGFDPLQGHRIDWQGGSGPDPKLQLVNGILYGGTKPLAAVLSPVAGGPGWQPLAYGSDAVLRGNAGVAAVSTDPLALSEDTPFSIRFSDLLGAAAPDSFTIAAVSGDGQLAISFSGRTAADTLSLTPARDFFGTTSLLVSLADGSGATVRVPISVAAVADAPRQLQLLSLRTDEDTPLTLSVAELCAAYLDADRFDLVRFVSLADAPGQAGDAFAIAHDPAADTITITPAAAFNGSRSLRLTVQADSGEHSFDLELTVDPLDDLPSGSDGPVLLEAGQPLALSNDSHFKLSDSDGSSFDPARDGIRITVYPAAGELLFKATPDSEAEILQLQERRLLSLDQLNAGQLLYQHDGITYNDALITDFIQYVIIQNNGAVVSAPQVLALVDASQADSGQSGQEPEGPPEGPQAPVITSFEPRVDAAGLQVQFAFDQPLQREGGAIRLYLAADPLNPDQLELIASVDTTDPAVVIAEENGGGTLALSLPIERLGSLQGKEGYLMIDLVSQGDVLRTAAGLSVVGDAALYGLPVDLAAPELLGYSFINQADSLVLELQFSEPVSSSGLLRLESVNAITGAVQAIGTLRPSSTPAATTGAPQLAPSSDVLVDLSDLVQTLVIKPGQRYRVVIDAETGLKGGHGSAALLEQAFDLPFPNSAIFAAAKASALPVPATPFHLYFSLAKMLSDGEQQPYPLELLGLGKPDPVLLGKPFTLSNLDTELQSGSLYSLGLNLYTAAAAPDGDLDSLLAGASAFRVTLQYVREEFWIDSQRISGPNLSGVSTTVLPERNAAGQQLVQLELAFERGEGWSLAATADGRGLSLAQVVLEPIPYASSSGLPDSFPSLLVSSVSFAATAPAAAAAPAAEEGIAAAAAAEPDLSLPQLILSKGNTFSGAAANGPLLLTSPEITVEEDSEGVGGLVEVRSLVGLPKDGGLSVSLEPDPDQGTLTFDPLAGIWTYAPKPDAYGQDRFELQVVDSRGRSSRQAFSVTIINVNDAPLGELVAQLSDPDGNPVTDRSPRQGDRLTAQLAEPLTDADGLESVSFAYQWFADGTPIVGATGSTLTISQAEVGKTLWLALSYTDNGGSQEELSSGLSDVVLNVNDAPTGRVAILGSPNRYDSVLTASAAGLIELDGLADSIAWSWYAQGPEDSSAFAITDALIGGEGQPFTGPTFSFSKDLFEALKGRQISVRASYTDRFGASESSSGEQDPVLTSALTSLVKKPGIQRIGTSRRELLVGSEGDDTISGRQGDDMIYGLAAEDLLDGESGRDLIAGGDGDDTLLGGLNADTLSGDAGADSLDGGAGDDQLDGGAGSDTLLGAQGNDALLGGEGADELQGGDGLDLLVGGPEADRLIGGAASDLHRIRDLADSLLGQHDVIIGLQIQEDRIDGPFRVAAPRLRQLGAVDSLTDVAIQAVLTPALFPGRGAATFSLKGSDRTFLALNDRINGFDAATDGIIEISGFGGNLAYLSVV